jgi:hypothetical protein
MSEARHFGNWRFVPSEAFLRAEDRMLFEGPICWAEKPNGIKVTRTFFRSFDAVCSMQYFGRDFSIKFSAYPVIALDPEEWRSPPLFLEYYAKIETTDLCMHIPDVLGDMEEAGLAEFLTDIQDSNLYECIFDGQADWAGEALDIQYMERLFRPVSNFNLEPEGLLFPHHKGQMD